MAQPDLVALVSHLLSTNADTVSGSALSPEEATLLRDCGFIVEQGLATTIWCENCDEGHPAEVVRHPVSGAPAIRCPDAGYEELSPDRLRAYSIDRTAIAVAIARALAIPSRMVEEPVPGSLWRLGFAKANTRTVEVFFLGAPADQNGMENELRERAGAHTLLLHPSRLVPVGLSENTRGLTVEDLFGLSVELEVDPDHFENLLQRFWPPRSPPHPGRPSGRAATLEVAKNLREKGELPTGARPGARAIRDAWPSVLPDVACPAESTIRGHLADLSLGTKQEQI